MKEQWTYFSDGLQGLALAFEWWWDLLSIPQSCDSLCEYADFWEEISHGWYEEYVWPYDDLFTPGPSPERKLRLRGGR